VEGVRSLGGEDRREDGEPCEEERLVSLGHSAGGERHSLHPQEQTHLVEKPAPRGSVSTENVMCLLEHQHYRCALTGRWLTPQTAALDHIMPIRRGGEHVIENTQVLHKDVNRAKGSLTSEEFRAMCHEVVCWCDSAPETGPCKC
jgi:5-methylcytosine-specific restriction endonuclease McrA